MISKLNIGLALSRNFDKVTLEMIDEPVEYENDDELKAQIKRRFNLLRSEVDEEFKKVQKW